MRRCLELARIGAGYVAPNPMVGAVLVHAGRIIGEGYHRVYGQAHAEVNCVASVRPEDRSLIPQSTMYVSLEPCAHFGRTPPCADMLVRERIPRVVIGCRDPFPKVDGKGIDKLLAAGTEVVVGVLEKECQELNKRFFTFHSLHRPWIVLKWAQSANGKIAGRAEDGRTLISNALTNRLVHKWRSEEASILVGTRTALLDDPALTVRHWTGPDPVRLVLDKELRLPEGLRLFNGETRTIVFNMLRHGAGEAEKGGHGAGGQEGTLPGTGGAGGGAEGAARIAPEYYQLAGDSSVVHQIVHALYRENIQSVLVEGGARLLQSFIDEGYWDEARVITNDTLLIRDGLAAPVLPDGMPVVKEERSGSDMIRYYKWKELGQ